MLLAGEIGMKEETMITLVTKYMQLPIKRILAYKER